MTHEEIRARLFAAVHGLTRKESKEDLEEHCWATDLARADRLLAAHLEITKPLRDAAEELAGALENMVNGLERGSHEIDQRMYDDGVVALARYRAVKDAAP